MTDLRWCQLVADTCVERSVVYKDAVARLQTSETYLLAKRQFDAGASDRVLKGLLVRALIELGSEKGSRGQD